MDEFVNYNKRDIDLPMGCKNLMDVLQAKQSQEIQPAAASVALSVLAGHGYVEGKLSEVENYVQKLFASRSCVYMLVISALDERLTLNVGRMEDGTMWASATVQQGSIQQLALRDIFARRGWELPANVGNPPQFVPGVPVYQIFSLSPIPVQVSSLSALIADLFLEACASKSDPYLPVRYYTAEA
jgi:hypothetical protein